MAKSITSKSGKTLTHAKTHKTTHKKDNRVKPVYSEAFQKTRLQEDEAYLSNKNVKAFIYATSDAEGGDYDLKYGGIKGKANDKWKFSDYSTHPGAGSGGINTAAGRYQITIATWHEMGAKVGLTDFGPHTQDILAIEILRSIGAIGYIESGNINPALSLASNRWAALPQGKGLPGRYSGQPSKSYEEFSSYYRSYGGSIN